MKTVMYFYEENGGIYLQVFNALPTVSALFFNSKFSFIGNNYMFNLN